MGRGLNKLSAVAVKNAAPGKHSDGGGLWLHKRDDGGSQWFLRITVHGRRREIGLGSATDVSLKEARDAAERWRAMVRAGLDPIKERERQRREAARNLHYLKDIALDAFESRKAEMKGDGVAGRWLSPLEIYILPKLGKVPVADIDQRISGTHWRQSGTTRRRRHGRRSIGLPYACATLRRSASMLIFRRSKRLAHCSARSATGH